MYRLPSKTLAFVVSSLTAAAAPSVHAGTPSGPYSIFRYCPYQTNPDVGACVVATVTSGSFKMGNATVPIGAAITLQGGVRDLGDSPFYPAVGAPTMSPTPQEVPGGLLGIVNPAPDWPFPLWVAFWNIVDAVNGVTAVTEPAGAATANFGNAIFPPDTGDATAVHLPIRVRLQNPFLGNNCYIGSFSNPIVLNLVTNTTNPPPPNQPISGSVGTFSAEETTNPEGFINYITDSVLVDNSFAVPAASGCGNIALGLPIITPILQALVSGAVNLKEGFPSPAGRNTAIMANNVTIAAADYVRASEQ
jgi:hypothetical protein